MLEWSSHLHNLGLHIISLYLSLSARDFFNTWKYKDEQWLFSPLQKLAPLLQWAEILHDAMTAREAWVWSWILMCNKGIAKLSTESEEFLSMDEIGLCQLIIDIYSYFFHIWKDFLMILLQVWKENHSRNSIVIFKILSGLAIWNGAWLHYCTIYSSKRWCLKQ